jgi:lipoate-protein ligase B
LLWADQLTFKIACGISQVQFNKSNLSSQLDLINLGLVDYKSAWDLQKKLQQERISAKIPDTLILCQHSPVITAGRSTKDGNLLVSTEELNKKNIQFFEVERGGEITYHDTNQITCYTILDLNDHKRDVHWFMRSLEDVIINFLKDFDIQGLKNPGFTGVWVLDENTKELKKIAAIGIRISRWVTMHGFSINIFKDLSGFDLINPCGLKNIKVTAIENELLKHRIIGDVANYLERLDNIKFKLVEHFRQVFNYM